MIWGRMRLKHNLKKQLDQTEKIKFCRLRKSLITAILKQSWSRSQTCLVFLWKVDDKKLRANANRTRSYFLGPLSIAIMVSPIMWLSDLWYHYRSVNLKDKLLICYFKGVKKVFFMWTSYSGKSSFWSPSMIHIFYINNCLNNFWPFLLEHILHPLLVSWRIKIWRSKKLRPGTFSTRQSTRH